MFKSFKPFNLSRRLISLWLSFCTLRSSRYEFSAFQWFNGSGRFAASLGRTRSNWLSNRERSRYWLLVGHRTGHGNIVKPGDVFPHEFGAHPGR
jgi:hypothetical protein